MKARENAPNASSLELTLDPGETFGAFRWPDTSSGPTKLVIIRAVNPASPDDVRAAQAADIEALNELLGNGLQIEKWVDQAIPRSFSVSSAQAMIQLSRMPYGGPIAPDAKNIAQALQVLVDRSGDDELKTWFQRAQRWVLSNRNVSKIGRAFSLTDAEILAAFQAASKIEE